MDALIDDRATFNIGMVVEETGVPADTLRAWERRYGLPNPTRTEGGHRLYSAQDIATIHWLLGSKDRGMSIRQAVELWRQKQPQGQPRAAQQELAAGMVGISLDATKTSWRQACLEFDEARAENIAAQAFALYPAEAVMTQILFPALAEIGEGWQRNQLSVQQEHFATGLVERRLHTLIAACPAPTKAQTIVTAGPPGEEHGLGLLYLAWRLRRMGWPVVNLRVNVPREHLEAMLRQVQPIAVLMAVSHLPAAAALLPMAEALNGFGVPLIYGGRAFSVYADLQPYIAGTYIGDGLDQAVNRLEQLLAQPPKSVTASAFPMSNPSLESALRGRLSAVGLAVARALSRLPIEANEIELANQHWADNLLAAARFGRFDLLHKSLEWIAGLLHYRGLPEEALVAYLEAYQQVAEQHLGEEFQPVLAEIRRVITDYSTSIAAQKTR